MIKKSVMIPIETDEDGLPIERDNLHTPFSRGVMTFDDFNYKMFNQYVLLTGPDNKQDKVEKHESDLYVSAK